MSEEPVGFCNAENQALNGKGQQIDALSARLQAASPADTLKSTRNFGWRDSPGIYCRDYDMAPRANRHQRIGISGRHFEQSVFSQLDAMRSGT